MTRDALEKLIVDLPPKDLVWGGDWNQSLVGKDYAGSIGGLRHLLAAIDQLGLQVPTADLPHRLPGVASIDHIAAARGLPMSAGCRVVAQAAGVRLSDHDLYTVEIA
jgi:hypothetical protein